MKSIWKFTLAAPGNRVRLAIPIGAELLDVQIQEGMSADYITAWFIVDPNVMTEARVFETIGTGWDVPEGAKYLGTVQQGSYVWHALEIFDV